MQPLLKWAGGKRWLFDQSFIATLPNFRRYVEPFLGGGAGYFALCPRNALLSDLNPELINLYQVVRDRPRELERLIAEHQKSHSKEYYYSVREAKPRGRIQSAARMLYLNRTCWNGLYRLNKNGEFNVPIGTKTAVTMPTDDFIGMSELLKSANITACDFQTTIDQCGLGDLIFVDPPYTVKHNMNGFVKYNETIFSWSDQIRLRDCLVDAVDRGASVILTNADHSSVRDLYNGFGSHASIYRSSIISGKNDGRSEVTELLVRG